MAKKRLKPGQYAKDWFGRRAEDSYIKRDNTNKAFSWDKGRKHLSSFMIGENASMKESAKMVGTMFSVMDVNKHTRVASKKLSDKMGKGAVSQTSNIITLPLGILKDEETGTWADIKEMDKLDAFYGACIQNAGKISMQSAGEYRDMMDERRGRSRKKKGVKSLLSEVINTERINDKIASRFPGYSKFVQKFKDYTYDKNYEPLDPSEHPQKRLMDLITRMIRYPDHITEEELEEFKEPIKKMEKALKKFDGIPSSKAGCDSMAKSFSNIVYKYVPVEEEPPPPPSSGSGGDDAEDEDDKGFGDGVAKSKVGDDESEEGTGSGGGSDDEKEEEERKEEKEDEKSEDESDSSEEEDKDKSESGGDDEKEDEEEKPESYDSGSPEDSGDDTPEDGEPSGDKGFDYKDKPLPKEDLDDFAKEMLEDIDDAEDMEGVTEEDVEDFKEEMVEDKDPTDIEHEYVPTVGVSYSPVFFKKSETNKLRYEKTRDRIDFTKAQVIRSMFERKSKHYDYAMKGMKSGRLDGTKIAEAIQGVETVYERISTVSTNKVLVGVLVDESGSMNGTPIDKAREAAIFINEIFRKMNDVELFIYGHTGDEHIFDSNETVIRVYKERGFQNDIHALGSITARSQNRDGLAILATAKRIRKFNQDPGILFVLSDGQPSASGYGGSSGIRDTRERVTQAQALGFQIIQIAIEESVPSAEMFDYFVKMTNISELPRTLANYMSTKIDKMIKETITL